MTNYQRVTRGFEILTEVLAPYVIQQLQAKFRRNWWRDGVLRALYEDQTRDLPDDGDDVTLMDSLDVARCLILMDVHWKEIFRLKLSREHLNWIKELITTRNAWAHKGSGDFSDEDAWRALDTMARLVEQLDSDAAQEVRSLLREVRYRASVSSTAPATEGVAPSTPGQTAVLAASPRYGLLPWRDVISPHPDVAQGRYRQAEFAADLSLVVQGRAEWEYQDPVEFFARTYITEGMMGLLVQAVRRVAGLGGEPVIQLKTSFGGGKTHSMLALYHLLRGRISPNNIPSAHEILQKAGVSEIPRTRVAAIVGTALNPAKVRRPNNLPGITVRTLWGEIAAQLAEQSGDPAVYNFVREADEKSVSPGSEALREMLDYCGPCLILIDELVAYARRIYGVPGLPAGTFDSVLSFAQELTEAARASKNSIVVASIPESDIEAGGEIGRQVLEILAHTFGRMESIWKPVSAEEGFAIVRRRLFLPVQDEAAKYQVCRAFSEMYTQGAGDFPSECRELAYAERLKECYPIHPEVFDRLYNDWASLERFQKTRGVLRLMAAVIHELWVRGDNSLLIMPGSIPLDSIQVREELTRHLPEGWNSVIEKDVDGPRSQIHAIDAGNSRFGRSLAARRVARTIFLGSAPSVRAQRNRGIEDIRVRLGVVQPGEQVAIFNDALGHMMDRLTHLYAAQSRYWYDLPPNLRRTVEDRAQMVKQEDVLMELENRLRGMRDKGDFAGVHICPSSSMDVSDDQSVRLVVLGPQHTHKQGQSDSPATVFASDILHNRGNGPRLYRNMLVFVAPDREVMNSLEQETRRYLAWQSVFNDREALNLDAHQTKEAKSGMERSNETVNLRLKEAYVWLLVPTQDGAGPVEWDVTRLAGGGEESHAVKASRKLRQSEQLITKWGPALLRMELDKWLWVNDDKIQIRTLWEHLASYCYLPRLKDRDVLMEAIKEGIAVRDYFGYASGVTSLGEYLEPGLADAGLASRVQPSGFLIKPDVAERVLAQLAAQRQAAAARMPGVQAGPDGAGSSSTGLVHVNGPVGQPSGGTMQPGIQPPGVPGPQVAPEKKLRRFHASVSIDALRLSRDGDTIAREVLQHLLGLMGCDVRVTLEIEAYTPDGVPESVVRTVTENCRTLKFKDHGFEEY